MKCVFTEITNYALYISNIAKDEDIYTRVSNSIWEQLIKKLNIKQDPLKYFIPLVNTILPPVEWIYPNFTLEDFEDLNNFKPKYFLVISDEEVIEPITLNDIPIIEFITISNDDFNKAIEDILPEIKKDLESLKDGKQDH